MKSDETGVLNKSDLYFSSPSPTAKRLYYYLISAGHFYCTANYHLIRKNYDSLLVTHIIDGSFTFVVKGRHITARQGDTVLLDCFHPHEYYTNDSFESIWVHFNGPDCLNWYHEIIRNEGNLIQSGNPEQIEGLIFRLYDGIRTADATPEIDLSLELYRLLAEFARRAKRRKQPPLRGKYPRRQAVCQRAFKSNHSCRRSCSGSPYEPLAFLSGF